MKTRGAFAFCGGLAFLLLARIPATANHQHFIQITNNTSQPITGVTVVFNTPKNGPISIHKKANMALRDVVKFTLPDTIKDKYGATVDLSSSCQMDLNLIEKDGTSNWLRNRDLCASSYIDARDSAAYAYSSYTYATPIPDTSAAPQTPAPTPTASLSPSDEQVNRGAQLFEQGRFSEANKFFDAALKLDPNDSWALAYRGRTYFLMDQFDKSLADLDRGLRIVPDNTLLHALRGLTLWSMGVYGSAADDFVATYQKAPEYSYWAAVAAAADLDNGDRKAARAILLQCKKQCTDKKTFNYLIIRYMLGEVGASALLAAAKTPLDRSDAHAFIGLADLQRGDSRGAKPYFLWIVHNAAPYNNWLPNIRQRLKRMH